MFIILHSGGRTSRWGLAPVQDRDYPACDEVHRLTVIAQQQMRRSAPTQFPQASAERRLAAVCADGDPQDNADPCSAWIRGRRLCVEIGFAMVLASKRPMYMVLRQWARRHSHRVIVSRHRIDTHRTRFGLGGRRDLYLPVDRHFLTWPRTNTQPPMGLTPPPTSVCRKAAARFYRGVQLPFTDTVATRQGLAHVRPLSRIIEARE